VRDALARVQVFCMPNRLAQETSPYLQQHADNPVEWYPWGDEALRLAREQAKPILLSVGYSACHWCHVMAHESFEDPAIAGVMNRLFVNIKVDREERPDIDQIYQTAHQLLTRRGGGWPLTMFLTPDQRPFFGGTYFPKTPRYNLPGFGELLEKVAQAYREQGEAIAAQNEELVALLARTVPPSPARPPQLDRAVVDAAVKALVASFDPVHGGLGAAPKFPHPFELDLCLSEGVTRGNAQAEHAALFTLERMALGGVYDQLGGGFYRYSVDGHWSIPHFEKMLYDNGPLLRLYADAWLVTGNPLFASVCRETAAWVVREMQAPEGGYYSSLDADSEHEEGKFYVWSREDVAARLSGEEHAVAARVFGLDGAPNFEGAHWHLRIAQPLEQAAAALGIDEPAAGALLDSARRKLFDAREQRVHTGRDEKVLTAWNALMIEAMAHAGRALGEPAWIESARRALGFVRATLFRDGRLLATYKDGRAHLNAYLDDYAFLIGALLELMQAGFERADLTFACELADVLLDQFEDRSAGGFFFTSHDHERLIVRTKPGHDSATPSGNGRAALALVRLGHLIGEPRYLAAAQRTLELFHPQMTEYPGGFATLYAALMEQVQPPSIVILRGEAAAAAPWAQRLARRYAPHELTVGLAAQESGLPDALAKPLLPGVNAWVCRGVSCLPPIADAGELERVLQASP
jgi:uncharacterized protein YyaL (SSP411 family)